MGFRRLAFRAPESVHECVVNVSREPAQTRDGELYHQIRQLSRLSIAGLKVKYRDTFGEEARVLHKQFLVRRIAWRLQARRHGDLSQRARQRIAAIGDASDFGSYSTAESGNGAASHQLRKPPLQAGSQRDPRLPPVGTLLRRRYQGREIVVKVLDNGFECDSERYRSLSELARELTGTRWNGLLFFGLAERRNG